MSTEDIYSDGGFPFIKICIKDDVIAEEKTKREFNPKNVMSIQSILEKRKSTPFLSLEQKRSISVGSKSNSDSDTDIKFNHKYDIQKSIHDISNLDVTDLMKPKRPKKKTKKDKKSK